MPLNINARIWIFKILNRNHSFAGRTYFYDYTWYFSQRHLFWKIRSGLSQTHSPQDVDPRGSQGHFSYPPFPFPDAKNARIGCASHFHARPFDFMNIVGERPSFYNSRRATTRIARRTLQRASNARICKRPLPSPTPLFGKSTALFPRINQLEFEGSSKANGVVNGVVPRYVLFFSSEISKYRETRRFQDIFLSRNFPSSMKIEWLQNLTNYYELSSISKDLRYFGISFFSENPAKFNKLSCQASSMCSRNFFLSSSTNDCKI